MAPQTTMEERFGKCPYATAQSLISGKWAVLILLYLEAGPIRFNELLRSIKLLYSSIYFPIFRASLLQNLISDISPDRLIMFICQLFEGFIFCLCQSQRENFIS